MFINGYVLRLRTPRLGSNAVLSMIIWKLPACCVWQNGTSMNDHAQSVVVAEDGSITVGGYRETETESAFVVAKLDGDGDLLWQWEVSHLFWQWMRGLLMLSRSAQGDLESSTVTTLHQTSKWDPSSRLKDWFLLEICTHLKRFWAISGSSRPRLMFFCMYNFR